METIFAKIFMSSKYKKIILSQKIYTDNIEKLHIYSFETLDEFNSRCRGFETITNCNQNL